MAQSNFPSISANAQVYTVIVTSAVVDIKIENATVQGFIIRNIGPNPVYIKYGDECNSIIYTQLINPNTIFGDSYGGLITGCTAPNDTAVLLVTLKL